MSIRHSIRERILQVAEAKRVFWQRQASEEDTPCVVYWIVGGEFGEVDSCGASGPFKVTVEWFAASTDPEEAITLQEAVAAALHGSSWDLANTKVTLCAMTERTPDGYIEDTESQVYQAGCVMEVSYTS